MAKDKKTNIIYHWSLYRFGYCITICDVNEVKCMAALSEEYIKTYAKWNDLDETKCRDAILSPILDEFGEVDEYDEYNQFANDYRNAMECIERREYELGKVVWE